MIFAFDTKFYGPNIGYTKDYNGKIKVAESLTDDKLMV